jgi:hypothetical protein
MCLKSLHISDIVISFFFPPSLCLGLVSPVLVINSFDSKPFSLKVNHPSLLSVFFRPALLNHAHRSDAISVT